MMCLKQLAPGLHYRGTAFIVLVLSAMVTTATVNAAEIKVLSSGSIKLAMDQLLPDFQRSSGNVVTIEYNVSAAIANRIQNGELADVAISSSSLVEMLEGQGKVVQGSHINIAGVGIGVAVRKGASKPDISSVEAFKRALLSARSIGYLDPATGSLNGIYLASLFERLGIAQDLKSKTKLLGAISAIERVFEPVAKGDIDMQIGAMTEIVMAPGVDLVGPLPAEIQNISWFAAGVVATSQIPVAASALIRFISSPVAATVLKAKGYEHGPYSGAAILR
jgi:molybdate transport system substrate-binding protein